MGMGAFNKQVYPTYDELMIYFLFQSLDEKWKSITFDDVEFSAIFFFSEHLLIVYISQAGQEKSNRV